MAGGDAGPCGEGVGQWGLLNTQLREPPCGKVQREDGEAEGRLTHCCREGQLGTGVLGGPGRGGQS